MSSGQELVTTTADYLAYALDQPETRVIGLFLETVARCATRSGPACCGCRARHSRGGVDGWARPPTGRVLVDAHSGALAGDDAAWEALFATYGVHRVLGLDEMVDSLEAFSIGRRRLARAGHGIATVHDSGAERVLVADVAQQLGVPFAGIGDHTKTRLRSLIDPGLDVTNPLDVWGTGADTANIFTECLAALADDPDVALVALAVDLVPEYDGDHSYPEAVEALLARTGKPVVVLANLAASVDQIAAARLRARGVPVLEGTWSGLRTLGHLLADRPAAASQGEVDERRRARWLRVSSSAGDSTRRPRSRCWPITESPLPPRDPPRRSPKPWMPPRRSGSRSC